MLNINLNADDNNLFMNTIIPDGVFSDIVIHARIIYLYLKDLNSNS